MDIARSLVATALVVGAVALAGCRKETDRIAVPGASPTIPTSVQGKNVQEFHRTISSSTDSNLCVTCHGAMWDRVSLDPAYPDIHRLKLAPTTGLLANWVCTDCHGATDMVQHSGANLRKNVDVEKVCNKCHNGQQGIKRLYQ